MLIAALLAQAAVAAAPAPAAAQEGVLSYPASFFGSFNSNNAYEMVSHIPGFTLDTGATVRGFEGAAGNVLIDGQRPSSKSDTIDQILQRIPIGQVERIDIIRGGAPGIDMQGKSVLANVIRKKSGGFRGLLAYAHNYVVDTGRQQPTVRIEGSGGSNGRNWEASLRGGMNADDGAGPGTEARFDGRGQPVSASSISAHAGNKQATAAGSYETPFMGGRARINGRYYYNDYRSYETNSGLPPLLQVNHDRYEDHESDTELGGRFNRAFGARVNIEAVALRTTKDETVTDRYQENPGVLTAFQNDRYSTETIGRAVVKFIQTPRLSWEAGGEAALNKLDSDTTVDVDGAAIPLPAASVVVKERRWEVFGKATWRPVERLTLEASLKQEGSHISSRGDVMLAKDLYFTKPKIGASWDIDADDQIRVRYEREVGQLNFDDFVAGSQLTTGTLTAGNPDLNPEQAWVAEAAWEHRFWTSGSVVFTYRHYDLKDAVDRAPIFNPDGSFFDGPANIGDGTKEEYVLSLTAPLGRFGLSGAQLKGVVTRRRSEVTDPTTHVGRPISKLRPLEWEAHYTQPLPWANSNWGFDVCCSWRQTIYRVDTVEDQKLPPFIALYAEWKPRPDLQLHIEADNLLARGFHDFRTVYDGPRSSGGIRVIDARPQDFSREIFVRVRKYFG